MGGTWRDPSRGPTVHHALKGIWRQLEAASQEFWQPPRRWRGEVIAAQDEDWRTSRQDVATRRIQPPAFAPVIEPPRVRRQKAHACMAGGPPRQCVRVEREPGAVVEVEVPTHKPLGVDGAVSAFGLPVQMKDPGRRRVRPPAGAHRAPAHEPSVLVRSKDLRGLMHHGHFWLGLSPGPQPW